MLNFEALLGPDRLGKGLAPFRCGAVLAQLDTALVGPEQQDESKTLRLHRLRVLQGLQTEQHVHGPCH